MTNEEVIKILKNEYLCRINIKDGCYPWKCKNCEYSEDKDDVTQAINYAVQALSKQSASSEQADTKLFNRGYWLMPGEVFISHNVLNEVLNTIIKSINTEQRKIDSILAKTSENDEAIHIDDQCGDDTEMVDQFREVTKKTDEVSISKHEVLTNIRKLCDGCYLMEHCGQCNPECRLRQAIDMIEESSSVPMIPKKPSEDGESEINNSDEWWKNYIRSRMSRDDGTETNVGKTDFKPGDKFVLELGEERRMFDEFEIAGTDLYVKTDLLEKLTRYEPEEKLEVKSEIICDPDCDGFVCSQNGIYGWCPKMEHWGCEYFYELKRRNDG